METQCLRSLRCFLCKHNLKQILEISHQECLILCATVCYCKICKFWGLGNACFQLACWWSGLESGHELRGPLGTIWNRKILLSNTLIWAASSFPKDHVGPVALVGSILTALLLSSIHAALSLAQTTGSFDCCWLHLVVSETSCNHVNHVLWFKKSSDIFRMNGLCPFTASPCCQGLLVCRMMIFSSGEWDS